jgi:lipopolysaccharide/colanic/teichoic acid biosynthesis glycosyltransferase
VTWRAAQRLIAALLLIVLSPLLVTLAVLIRLTSPGPALHRAVRARHPGEFVIYKLRTMRSDGTGSAITAEGDPRVTPLGRVLRRSKLDELPQLWNVVKGDMLLVGPRPEDPKFIDPANSLHALVFSATPGITGPTALAYRDEETLLAEHAATLARTAGRTTPTADDVERAYRESILPGKLALDAEYLRTRSLRGDIGILWETVAGSIRHPAQGGHP